MVEKGMS